MPPDLSIPLRGIIPAPVLPCWPLARVMDLSIHLREFLFGLAPYPEFHLHETNPCHDCLPRSPQGGCLRCCPGHTGLRRRRPGPWPDPPGQPRLSGQRLHRDFPRLSWQYRRGGRQRLQTRPGSAPAERWRQHHHPAHPACRCRRQLQGPGSGSARVAGGHPPGGRAERQPGLCRNPRLQDLAQNPVLGHQQLRHPPCRAEPGPLSGRLQREEPRHLRHLRRGPPAGQTV